MEQPEAIRLAAVCDLGHPLEDDVALIGPELLRLHAVELEALELRAELSQEKEVVAALLAEQDRLQCALNKRHAQVERLTRELYQATNPPFIGKTDSWQAACGKARTERDEARAQVERLQAASVEWSPAYTRGPARQSAPVTAVPALVPLSVLQYNQIPELCQIRPSLYESVVRAIEAAIAKINGLTVGDGGQG